MSASIGAMRSWEKGQSVILLKSNAKTWERRKLASAEKSDLWNVTRNCFDFVGQGKPMMEIFIKKSNIVVIHPGVDGDGY